MRLWLGSLGTCWGSNYTPTTRKRHSTINAILSDTFTFAVRAYPLINVVHRAIAVGASLYFHVTSPLPSIFPGLVYGGLYAVKWNATEFEFAR